ncbi:MAG: hypothetical protein GON13_02305 [Nanoarchaeota archaeon]|nr:hypothetical protein [Nanoarchaeota archaeon]
MSILCFGSKVSGDDLAWRVGDVLGFKNSNNVHELKNGDVVVDVVWGLSDVRFVKLNELKSHKAVSVHDFDLGTYLRLMKGILKVKVIGIPKNYELINAVEKVKELLE